MKGVKEKISANTLTIGSWISIGSTQITEMMARSQFEWFVIDMEHTSITFDIAEDLIRVIDLHGKYPFVRVGKNESLQIKRVLDSGANGIVVPRVNTKTKAQKAVASAYYPPKGSRGVGLYRAQNYGEGFKTYKEGLDDTIVVVVQIEHIDGVNNIESILSVDGVDGFIVGPYDLSASMGYPGQFDEPIVKEALSKVESFVAKNKKAGGYHIVRQNQQKLTEIIRSGYRLIAYGVDMVMFNNTLSKINQDIKSK